MSIAAGLVAIPATANAEAPILGLIRASGEYSGQETIEAQIDPESYETVWTISLDCPDQRRCQNMEGRLPADDESHTVIVVMAGLETDTHYQYTVEASSLAGATSFAGEFKSIPPGAAPKGVKEEEVYVPPELPWANQSGDEAAARTVREQREREQEEEKAKEDRASRAAEEAALKHRQQESAQEPAASRRQQPICVVPLLKGDTLATARRALVAAHCRLGVVHRAIHGYGRFRVTGQSARAGKRLADSARVALWIGARSNHK